MARLAWKAEQSGPGTVKPSSPHVNRLTYLQGGEWGLGWGEGHTGCLRLSSLGEGGHEVDDGGGKGVCLNVGQSNLRLRGTWRLPYPLSSPLLKTSSSQHL